MAEAESMVWNGRSPWLGSGRVGGRSALAARKRGSGDESLLRDDGADSQTWRWDGRAGGDSLSGRARGGFTLIEAVIVLALLAMGAGLLLPDLAGRLGRTRLERVARDLELICRESWQSAITTGRDRWVVAREDGLGLEVRDGAPGGPVLERTFLAPRELPAWCEVTGLEQGWSARAEGWCDPGPLQVRDRETGERLVIRFRPWDGEVVSE